MSGAWNVIGSQRLRQRREVPHRPRLVVLEVRLTNRLPEPTTIPAWRRLLAEWMYGCHILEQTSLLIQRIAERAGFGSAIAFRRHFAREVGTTPLEYRRVCRGDSKRV